MPGGIACGLISAEISAQLNISSTTVKSHVSNVLGKPEHRDCTQAVVFADEAGIIVKREQKSA